MIAVWQFLSFALCAYGIAFTLVHSKVTLGFRLRVAAGTSVFAKFITDLLSCIFCTGFYAGLCAALLLGLVSEFTLADFTHFLAYGFAGAASSLLLDSFALKLEK